MSHIKDNDLLRVFNQRMKTLREDGVFTTQKRSVVGGSRYLIVSYGGTGAEALFQIRRTLRKTLPEDQYNNYIRFLAIDTDRNTNKQTELVDNGDGTKTTEVKDALNPEEFCWLDGAKARNALNPIDKEIKGWINPGLPGLINADSSYLDGSGASATRQVGRLTLFPAAVCSSLQQKVQKHVRDLITGNLDNLYVMVVTGISGGTGSGTVIDATYLIRDAVEKVTHGLGDRTKICGFILLPPTGDMNATPVNQAKGNRNGYAALKEINHFMTLASRKDRYHQTFGGVTVDSGKSIFDICYLMDGKQLDVLVKDHREFVKTVLADCVVDMISSQPTADDGTVAPRAIESLTSDITAHTISMLSTQNDTAAPRDADYLYCVLGHGKVPIPVDEIKTYVAKKIFDKMYKSYQNGGDVAQDEVKSFVNYINNNQWRSRVDSKLNEYFADLEYGPFFVINLLYEAIPEVQRRQNVIFAPRDRLEDIEKYLRRLNSTYFSVFTEVLESLKGILDEQYNMVCEGTYSQNARGGSLYSFQPISLENGDNANNVIRTYLSELVTNSRVNALSEELLKTIIENRDVWARLDQKATANGPAFDAPAQIRIFWEREITKIVNATIEDLLIKIYANDKNAKYIENDEESQATLKKAARAIYDSMFSATGASLPTASLETGKGLDLTHFNGHNYMMVPQEAPHLLQELRTIAEGTNVQVYGSTASDCISCYTQYTSIPASKFVWTKTGEECYEKDIGYMGLHMAETSGSNEWRDLPNLLPKSTWERLGEGVYTNPREEKLANRAQELFDRAKGLSLTKAVPAIGVDLLQYSMKRLRDDLLPDQDLFKEFDVRDVSAADQATIADREKIWAEIQEQAKSAAQKLYNSVDDWLTVKDIVGTLEKADPTVFTLKELRTVDAVLQLPSMPDGWSEQIAARFLRKMPKLMSDLRGTVMVMDYLKEMVEATQAETLQIVDFTKYMVADMFYFDETDWTWKYSDGSREHNLFFQSPLDAVSKYAPYYFMFEAYKKNSAEIKGDLEPEYETISGVGDDAVEVVKKLLALNEKAGKLYEANEKKLKLDKKNPDPMTQLGSTAFIKAATAKGYDAQAIMDMYENMNATIKAQFNIEVSSK